jgi:hypothetical protein
VDDEDVVAVADAVSDGVLVTVGEGDGVAVSVLVGESDHDDD